MYISENIFYIWYNFKNLLAHFAANIECWEVDYKAPPTSPCLVGLRQPVGFITQPSNTISGRNTWNNQQNGA